MRIFGLFLLSVLIAVIGLGLWASHRSRAADEATRIEFDQQQNIIRFIVDGQEQAVLDSDGLHVNGSIDYSGTITDGNRYSRTPSDKRVAE